MVIKKTPGEHIFDTVNILLMCVLMFICLYPFVYVILASFSDPVQVAKTTGLLLYPKGLNVAAYKAVFSNDTIISGYRNTLIVVVAGTFINLIMTSLGAYPLSRKHLYGGKVFSFLIVFTMYFGGGLIPNYMIVKSLGMYNSLLALMIPSAISAYNLMVLRAGFSGIPVELEESAKMDGANDIYILFKIMLPLAKPVLAVIALWYGVGHWNSFFSAMIYIRDRNLYPLSLVLRDILIQNTSSDFSAGSGGDTFMIGENIKYGLIVVSTVPILMVYPFIQKYFVKGVMVGAVKG